MPRLTRAMRLGTFMALLGAAGMGAGCRPGIDISPNDPGIRDVTAMTEAASPLGELEFLSGQWRTLEEKELSEELWSVPHGDSIIGTFRMTEPDGSMRMQEVLAIVGGPDGVFMRLRHFDAKMISREEKDAPIVLKLESAAKQRAIFRCVSGSKSLDSITYWREEQTLYSEVAFTPESRRETLRFAMRRLGAYPY